MSFSTTVAQRGVETPWDDLILALAGGNVSKYALIKGVIARESEWNPNAINPSDPSYGLMQILAGSGGPAPGVNPQDLLDPETSIIIGSRFLLGQIQRFGEADGISAYNAGRPITGNRDYVADIQQYQVYYLNHLPSRVSPDPIEGFDAMTDLYPAGWSEGAPGESWMTGSTGIGVGLLILGMLLLVMRR